MKTQAHTVRSEVQRLAWIRQLTAIIEYFDQPTSELMESANLLVPVTRWLYFKSRSNSRMLRTARQSAQRRWSLGGPVEELSESQLQTRAGSFAASQCFSCQCHRDVSSLLRASAIQRGRSTMCPHMTSLPIRPYFAPLGVSHGLQSVQLKRS